jgi:hypothetical protein
LHKQTNQKLQSNKIRFEGLENNYKCLQSKKVKGKKMKKYGVGNEWRIFKIKVQINV